MTRLSLILLTSLLFAGALHAQRMDVKRHLGFDFTNGIDEIRDYYSGLGVALEREEIRLEASERPDLPVLVRLVSFRNTPSFLSVETACINIGAINGRIEIITIVTADIFGSQTMDRKLHSFAKGNVTVRRTRERKEIEWSFENCKVVKQMVAAQDDSAQYMKYDIVPQTGN